MRVLVVNDSLPFSTCTPKIEGICVDIWNHIAAKLKIETQFIPGTSNVDDLIHRISKGEADALIGDVSVLRRRMHPDILFTRPFFVGTLRLYSLNKSSVFVRVFDTLKEHFMHIVLTIGIMTFLLTRVQRNLVPAEALYKVIYTLLSRSEAFPPDTNVKRALNILIIMFATTAITYFLSIVSREVFSKATLKLPPGSVIGVKKGTSYIDFVRMSGYKPMTFDDHNKILEAHRRGVVDAILADDLTFKISHSRDYEKFYHADNPFQFDEYAFVISGRKSDLIEKINEELVALQEGSTIDSIYTKFVPSREMLANMKL